ncbi:MAG: TonB-dependent receptor plug domain-containing protein [Gammaproteobacteria bacterium]
MSTRFNLEQCGWFRTLIRGAAMALLSLNGSVSAEPSQPGQSELADFSIDELMEMEVSSASRKSQRLSETAAAVFIVNQDDIRRSGASSIPEALRLVPGLEVAQIDSNHWAVSARGFNGKYANKLLVLIDGRTIYTPLFSGVFWNLQDTLMEDIERIEVIRGPGAVMWGSNAVNGVINVITKKAKDTQGNLFVAGGGNQEQGFAGFRHGGRVGDTNYRIYAKAFERAAFADSLGRRMHDDWRSVQTGFRVDHHASSDHRFTVQGDMYRKSVGNTVIPVTISAPFNRFYNVDDHADGANLLFRWGGNFNDGSEFSLQAYYDRVNFEALFLSDTQDMFDIDFQHRLHPSTNHDLMWGLNYRFIHSSAVNSSAISFTPASLGYHAGAVFVQDDISLIDHTLRLILGTKVEQSRFGNTQIQPNARLLWTPNAQQTIWASVSRASRTPSRGEAQSDIAFGVVPTGIATPPFDQAQLRVTHNPDLKAEKVFAAEIGYRSRWTSGFFTDIVAFNNQYADLIVFQREPFDFSTFSQSLRWYNESRDVTTRGIEVSADWTVFDWLRLTGSYSHLKMEVPRVGDLPDLAGLSPRHKATLRCQFDIDEKTQLDFTVRHVSKLTSTDQGAPAYTAFDARLAFQPIPSLELSVTAQNMFAPAHLEYRDNSTIFLPDFATQVPRSIYGKLSWNF